MAQKTLTFTKKPKDLSNRPEVGANIVKVGKLKFTMKDYRFNPYGHDDSLAYSATLCVDKKPLAHCHNDGYGGETNIEYINEEVKEIENTITNYQWKYAKTKFDLRLDFIADILAHTCDINQ